MAPLTDHFSAPLYFPPFQQMTKISPASQSTNGNQLIPNMVIRWWTILQPPFVRMQTPLKLNLERRNLLYVCAFPAFPFLPNFVSIYITVSKKNVCDRHLMLIREKYWKMSVIQYLSNLMHRCFTAVINTLKLKYKFEFHWFSITIFVPPDFVHFHCFPYEISSTWE